MEIKNIINCTPHEIVLYKECDYTYIPEQRKNFLNEGAKPLVAIPKSGYLLSIDFKLDASGYTFNGLRIKEQIAEGFDSPYHIEGYDPENDWLIVSALYVAGLAQMGKLTEFNTLNVSGVIYVNPERPAAVGCADLIVKTIRG